MAIKKYKAKITGVHALTGIALVRGEEYEIEESLAGSEIFEEIKPESIIPTKAEIQTPSSLKQGTIKKKLDSASSAE